MATSHRPPLWIAHRGESHDAPENTLASVNLAWERKVPAVEIDVRISRDGQPMIIHNPTTGYMAGTNWTVSRRSCAKLKTLDFGQKRGPAWAGITIPTLPEILDIVPDEGKLFIEIKAGVEAVEPIRKALAASRVQTEQIVLICFKRNILTRAAEAMPKYRTAWIIDLHKSTAETGAEAIRLSRLAHRHGFQSLNLGLNASSDLDIIPALQEQGLKVLCWTVNDRRLARRLIRAGADGITSDRAAWLMGA